MATTTSTRIWTKTNGGYGRRAMMLHNADYRQVAIMVTLPKAYAQEYGHKYLVTDRRLVAHTERLETRYFEKRADAIRYAEETYPA